jgi:hypothetical protein
VEHLNLACRPEFIYGLSKDPEGVSHCRQYIGSSILDEDGGGPAGAGDQDDGDDAGSLILASGGRGGERARGVRRR